MKTILLTKKDWNLTAKYTYREDGYCIKVELPDDIPEDKIRPFYDAAKLNEKMIYALMIKDNNIHVEEKLDLSFEYLWKLYNYKNGKKNAEEQWNKLKDPDKLKCLRSIPKYNTKLFGTGTAKVYLERYIKNKRWEDFE
jgi:hypothetical protein